MRRAVVRQIEEIEGVERGLSGFRIAAAAIIALPEAHIFDDGQPRLNPVHVADVMEVALGARVALGAADPHAARRGRQKPRNRSQQRCLPRAIRAAKDERVSRAHFERQRRHHDMPAPLAGKPLHRDSQDGCRPRGRGAGAGQRLDIYQMKFSCQRAGAPIFMLVCGRLTRCIFARSKENSLWHP